MPMAHHTLREQWFWKHMAHQTIQMQLFECPRLTKRYVYISAGTHGSPNYTTTMVCVPAAHQALRIQWFGNTCLTKPYKYLGLIAQGTTSVTYTVVWGRIAHQTLQKHKFEYPWLTKRYISKGLRHMVHHTSQIQSFSICSI